MIAFTKKMIANVDRNIKSKYFFLYIAENPGERTRQKHENAFLKLQFSVIKSLTGLYFWSKKNRVTVIFS